MWPYLLSASALLGKGAAANWACRGNSRPCGRGAPYSLVNTLADRNAGLAERGSSRSRARSKLLWDNGAPAFPHRDSFTLKPDCSPKAPALLLDWWTT